MRIRDVGGWLLLALLLVASSSGRAAPNQGASFDCAMAKAPIEKVICADPWLADLDKELAEAYFRYRDLAEEPARGRELTAQRAFLSERFRRCDVPRKAGSKPLGAGPAATCLRAMYQGRLAELRMLIDTNRAFDQGASSVRPAALSGPTLRTEESATAIDSEITVQPRATGQESAAATSVSGQARVSAPADNPPSPATHWPTTVDEDEILECVVTEIRGRNAQNLKDYRIMDVASSHFVWKFDVETYMRTDTKSEALKKEIVRQFGEGFHYDLHGSSENCSKFIKYSYTTDDETPNGTAESLKEALAKASYQMFVNSGTLCKMPQTNEFVATVYTYWEVFSPSVCRDTCPGMLRYDPEACSRGRYGGCIMGKDESKIPTTVRCKVQ